jgi:hypothetical protein
MSYKGNDLSPDFIKWVTKEIKRISSILKSKGCTNIKLDYNFYYFSGFFTSESGQIYYISSMDQRFYPSADYLYRKADSYKDYSGKTNMYINKNKLNEIRL